MIKNTYILILLFVQCSTYIYCQTNKWQMKTMNSVKVDSITYSFNENIGLEDRIMTIKECENAINESLRLLNETEYTRAIDIVFVDSEKEMWRYTGREDKGVAYFFRNAIFSLTERNNISIKHEMMQMVLVDKWGIPDNSSLWIYEGMANYADSCCINYSLEDIYSYYIQSNKLIHLDSLANNLNNYNTVISQTESAYLVKYLINNFGIDKLKQLWTKGIKQFNNIYGFSVVEFEEKLIDDIKNKHLKKDDFNWEDFEKSYN